jgi:membrane-associated phospholipid phosphatase
MNYDSRISTDHLPLYESEIKLTGLSIVVWVVTGLICFAFDAQLQPLVHQWARDSALEWSAHYWCELGAIWGITLFVLAGLFSTIRYRDLTLLNFAASVSVAGIAAQLVKHAVGRVRPGSLEGPTQFYGPLAWFRVEHAVRIDSMPSGHTTAAFAMAIALSYRWPRWTVLWIVLASGVGISRTLTNSHYPSDVVFGALLGTFSCLVTHRLLARICQAKKLAQNSIQESTHLQDSLCDSQSLTSDPQCHKEPSSSAK